MTDDLQARIAALSPDKRELLERRLAEMAAERAPAADGRVEPRDRSVPTPLSFAQLREWTTGRIRGSNNIGGALRLVGDLDLSLLSRVLTEIVGRHEALRSTVELNDRTPVQVVQPVTPVPTPLVDLSDLPAEEQLGEVQRRADAELVRPFAPTDAQRLRIQLLRLAPDTHVALFTTDHAASDAWSMAILVREFVTLYGIHRTGGTGGLPLPEIQFGDYAALQAKEFTDERIATELAYWKQALDGVPTRLALPIDRPYPARPTFAGAQYHIDLSPELSEDLKVFSERENASLFMVLLATFSVLLHRYSGQDDLVVGSAISGRNRVETEQLIGCFANLLPLRMRLAEKQTLRELVHAARDTTTAGYDHQDLPFERLLEQLGIGREAAQTPLIQVMINVLTAPASTLEVPGLTITPEPMDIGPVSIDLTLFAMPRGDKVSLQWQYSTELFDTETVELLASQFVNVLRQLVTAPDTAVGDVEFIVAPATAAATPAPAAAADHGPGFVELFQRRAALAPHTPAVVHGGTALSYAELNRSANRLAHRLRERGVGQEVPVGILLDRSPRMAVAILAVLKAGGYYVPLDPSYPAERLAFMLTDADVRVLITEEESAAALTAAGDRPPGEILLVDASLDGPDHDLPTLPHPASPAYMVYTSGSTGRPKGAQIEHRSLVTFAREVVERFGLGSGDRFLQFASPSFDVLVEELFPIWLAGGVVVIPAERLLGGSADLAELVERERITVMELPTAYWHEWTRALRRQDRALAESLRLVIIGGERVLPDRITMWEPLGVPLMHVYGLTETTVSSTFFRIDPVDQSRDWPNLPIGTPLPSADLRILDSRLRPVPVGSLGDLYIGGVGLARGYHGRPGLTAQRFVADPDPAHPGGRLYRTGDLVRQRPDGNLEFVSRADTQIKIRGFRVEPAEIEATLSLHPEITESVVVVHEPEPGDKRLVAYVVPRTSPAPATGVLREFLEKELPPYMVPAAFVELDVLPLTPNGKVDHAALPAPTAERPAEATGFVAPRDPVEQQLAQIVASVIGVESIGAHDNFFELGGDSILAIQVVAQAQDIGIRISPLDLFEHPTVAALSAVTSAAPVIDAEQGVVSGPSPLTANQRWFCGSDLADPHHWNVSTLLELRESYPPDMLREAVVQLLVHHDGLRQRFQLNGVQTRVRIALPDSRTPFTAHDLSGLDPHAQDRRVTEVTAEAAAGLKPSVGPLVRFEFFGLGGGRPDRLAVIAHHLVADVTSLRILVEDLRTALLALGAGRTVALPAKTTSWQSWARRLASYAGTQPVQSQRPYWTDLVGEASHALPFDTAEDPGADTAADAREVVARLDAEETTELLHTVPAAHSCRIDDILLTALSRTLADWTGTPRNLVDLRRHSRDQVFGDISLARTVGRLDTVHPVGLVSEPDSSPETTLKSVKEALRAVPEGGLGWQLLCQGNDPLSPSPARLVFEYTGQLDEPSPATDGFTVIGPAGPAASPLGRRPYPLAVRAAITGGRLAVTWEYSHRLHSRETVERLAERFGAELRALTGDGEAMHTPSDFPLARVDQSQLDGLLDRLHTDREAP
ncbi:MULTISPECIES: non-ribosomal peptide synthetase [unclassified Streptomyces]|uniref:non-ribosomal peptide synthetase n=1 Tax=unclassified Streptomyces TaxID=2593676 RepID=UPI001F04B036|nr:MULTISPECIES: non-ribosomal peptide synthetase [unclassified Streptomyces]MCH0563647.1 amino acid adenylation domain-containing protein [Streptomyces sp. MUM 2J]MCH0570781.1 amino acid adenylation domain-containing protein [Streptomyces sp. MUM 136J]